MKLDGAILAYHQEIEKYGEDIVRNDEEAEEVKRRLEGLRKRGGGLREERRRVRLGLEELVNVKEVLRGFYGEEEAEGDGGGGGEMGDVVIVRPGE